MLNEFLALERGMAAYGFATVPRHPDLSQLLKGDVIRVRLEAGGGLAEIERLDGKSRPEIWTLRDGKQNSFPGLKTARGLIVLDEAAAADHEARWKAAKSPADQRAEIARLARTAVLDPLASQWPSPNYRRRIAERLDELRVLDADGDTRAVPAAFARFLVALALQPPLPHRLFARLVERAQNSDDGWLKIVRNALIGAVPLAIDVTRDFTRDAGDPAQIAAISRVLANGAQAGVNDGKICALTGATARLLEGNFPQPTLPSLGQTYLFSRNVDIAALARYGRNGPGSFPVDADLVSRFSGALAAVTEEARRGKTWRLLPSESGDRQDLFIAFIVSAPDAPIADSFAAENPENGEDDPASPVGPAEIEAATTSLADFWRGVAHKSPPDEHARILILRTVDPGNRKVIYDRTPTVHALHAAARGWAAAMNNMPTGIAFIVFKNKQPVVRQPRLQAPLSLISLSKALYVQGGRKMVEASGISGAAALALFLDEGDRAQRARHILRLLLQRQTGLLAGLAHAKRQGQLKDFDSTAIGRRHALRTISWIGALLFFLDRTRETYMEDVGFKLGQLLSAVDAVHIGYCEVVRNGQVPPTLVGNAVFAIAGRQPDRALDVLQMRWKPYHAWATRMAQETAKDDLRGRTIRSVTAQVSLASRLCKELHPLLARMREDGHTPNETFRAELLLGYLAGFVPEKKSTENPSSDKGVVA